MAYLVLVRHGISEWNTLGIWTGITDTELTDEGREEARRAAQVLGDIDLHRAYSSKLKRAKETLDLLMSQLAQENPETTEHAELNERDYGELTGKNKWEVKEQYGEEKFMAWRRSWDHPVPGGETLKDVSERVLPFYKERILKDLQDGKNVIVAAHGNSLRALMKYLEDVADEDAHTVEIMTGEVLVYEIDDNGKLVKKEIRLANDKKV